MDLTEEYIIKCNGAKAIQEIYQAKLLLPMEEGRKILPGWYIARVDTKGNLYGFILETRLIDQKFNYPDNLIHSVWLPCQHHLWALISKMDIFACHIELRYHGLRKWDILYIFHDDCSKYDIYRHNVFYPSAEQALLHFLMQSLYKTTWENITKTWVKL